MENPLCGSFNRERTILTFSQRSLEVQASYAAIAGGVAMVLIGAAKSFGILQRLPLDPIWWVFFGLSFSVSGIWAYLTFRNLRFDIRKRFYTERYMSGSRLAVKRGSIDEVYCLELGRYQGLLPSGQPATPSGGWGAPGPQRGNPGYAEPGTLLVLRLWWRDSGRAPIVIEHLQVGTAYGAQDQRAMHFLGLAQTYSQALRVPLTGSL